MKHLKDGFYHEVHEGNEVKKISLTCIHHTILLFSFLMISSCGINDYDVNKTEELLLNNTVWPYKITGYFDVFDAGDYDEYYHPGWIDGILFMENSEDDISVEYDKNIAKKFGFSFKDLEAGKPITLWIDKPGFYFGKPSFLIVQIKRN